MKVVLIHDYIKEYGGAERVLEALHEIWPEAPVYTTVYLPEFLGPHKERFKDWDIRTSWLQKFPYVEKLISPARVLSPWVFDNWDFRGFDLIIVSATGAYFPNLIVRKPYTLHICYCHTPPRYLYGYPTARDWQKYAIGRAIGGFVNHWLRQVDFISYQRPDYIIANSNEVRRRIEKFYRREATVIFPPVEIKSKVIPIKSGQKSKVSIRQGHSTELSRSPQDPEHIEGQVKSQNYYLAGGRLARAKRIDLAIEACNRLKLPLKVFGRAFADYGEELKKIAGPTIEFLGEISDGELVKLYQGAKVLIYPSEQEDFGILPVEAMAAGVPVIALNQGGVKETVIDGKTGVLFNKPTVEDLMAAIKHFNDIYHHSGWDAACRQQAEKFSKVRFKIEMERLVKKLTQKRRW